ncbi:hypothetical protein MUP35_04610 [Patescibacteria group bacterium]|nr:hypothetical protein [Patescibacteria group bacterium]
MVETDEGKEKGAPEFSSLAIIYDKKTGRDYRENISLPVDRLLKDFTIDSTDNKTKLSIKVRVDPSGKNGSPQVFIKNHNGLEVRYMLRERFNKRTNEKYFSLGAPPFSIPGKNKAIKADFRISFRFPSIS